MSKGSPSLHPTSLQSSEVSLRSSPDFSADPVKKAFSYYCEICHTNTARYVCRMCRRYVCGEHYDHRTRTCTLCLELLCSVCRHNLSVGYCTCCGRYVCHGCAIDIDGVRKVCYLCIIENTKVRDKVRAKFLGLK